MKAIADTSASFESAGNERSRVTGSLGFNTVTPLLPVGSAAIEQGHASIIDLAGVTSSDSSGLALLIEWVSVARAAKRSLHYENVPAQIHQLARLSDVDPLLSDVPAAK